MLRNVLTLLTVVLTIVLLWKLLDPGSGGVARPEFHRAAESAGGEPRARSEEPRRRVAPASRPAPREPAGMQFRVIGRIVRQSNGEGVPDAGLRLVVTDETRKTLGVSGRCDSEGRFSIASPVRNCVEAALVVTRIEEIEIVGPFEGTIDLGEIDVDVRTVWFRVSTPDGKPIPGACVHPEPGGTEVARARDDGHGSIDLGPVVTRLRATAPGFSLAHADLVTGLDSVTFTLERASTLDVEVTTVAGAVEPGSVSIRITCAESPFGLDPREVLWEAIGNPRLDLAVGDDRFFRSAHVTLSPMRPGIPMTVAAHDHRGGGVETSEHVVMSPGERRRLEIMLPGDYGRLSGRVVSSRDEPVAGVVVTYGKDGPVGKTDAEGGFDFGAVPAGSIHLKAFSASHAHWEAPAHRIFRGAEPVLIRLDDGVSLTVEVLDPDGAPASRASVYAGERSAETGPNGQARFDHLPVGRIEVSTYWQGRRTVVQHHTSSSHLEIALKDR